MQTKTTTTYFILTRTTKIKKTITSADKDMEKLQYEIMQPLWKSLAVPLKVKQS